MASLDISSEPRGGTGGPKVRRLNRLPVIIAIALTVIFSVVIIYGISTRGIYGPGGQGLDDTGGLPASSFGDRLKQGVPDGVIEAPQPEPIRVQPEPTPVVPAANPFQPAPPAASSPTPTGPVVEPEEDWRARLHREQEEQMLRELHRQRMASLQADQAAQDSPTAVDLKDLAVRSGEPSNPAAPGAGRPDLAGLYAASLQGAGQENVDPNGQAAKENFFNQDLKDLGYLPNQVVAPISPYELKRGSVIPATLITGVNSDLPGRIIAQVSQHVYDSATGHHVLIPQGTRLFGRYDSKVTFGQRRALVIWTDIVFPNGSTLQIGGMAGADMQGYGGFSDQVDNHYFEVFGSAILVAAIGAGIDMALPDDRGSADNSATDAARRSFAETFSEVADRTIGQNMDVQPTLEIRPGYLFNVLVDQDMVFPGPF
ncbi:IncP-type conjugal transfer protein TrbI [Novosphingobium resinovorum]|uniref:Conjugal transfer protein TrbI n=1 Tax=Novosphingobium resinovorum TaxID=158500 RepID=A0A1D8AGF9_9SPHN|nr:IncP-type conjugal transfer protein TrbI [Novosphingobium resinovorum]AOR81195.1 conjugal transfer protein TrbI [Novosphingobium resinovorum]